jgi:tetratricopeptide (TPR) repeat protein
MAGLRGVCRAVVGLLVVLPSPSILPQGLAGREDVWADFARSDLQGLQAMHAAGACDYVDREVDGVRCVATHGASGKHWLCFDVPRDFLPGNQPARYTLIIRYLDSPANGLVTVRYHGAQDAMAQAIRFQRQGSGEWLELVLTLPDAVFRNGTVGVADFAVHGFTDTGDPRAADVLVSGVWLSRRVLEVSAGPAAIPLGLPAAQQVSRVRALAYTGTGRLAPDGTVIQFTATGGTIKAEATTEGGVAETEFVSDTQSGTAIITADWDIVRGWTSIAKVPGDRLLREGRSVLETFEEIVPGELERVNADTSFADVVQAEGATGNCLQLHYCFHTGAPGQPYITCPFAVPIPGRPRTIHLNAKGDGSLHHFQLLMQDAQGTMYTIMTAARALQPGWQELAIPIEEYDDCWGPNADGMVDFPITIVGARFVCLGGNQLEGDLYLDDLGAEGLLPQETSAPAPAQAQAAAPRSPDGLLIPAQREPLGYIAENLLAIDDPDVLRVEVRNLRSTPTGRDVEALIGYRRLVELQPHDLNAQYTLGALLYRARAFEEALAHIEASMAQPTPHLNWAHLYRARLLDELARREEAAQEYASLAEAFPQTNRNSQYQHFPGIVRTWTEACQRAVGEPIPFYKRAPNASPAFGELTDRSHWSVQCNRGQERLPLAIDRNAETFWSIGGDAAGGDWFAIDLGEVVLDVARLVLDDGGATEIYQWDVTGELRIEGSVDGAKWELLGTAVGSPYTAIDVAWPPRPLRYLRATVTDKIAKGDLAEWRVHEAYVYRKVG